MVVSTDTNQFFNSTVQCWTQMIWTKNNKEANEKIDRQPSFACIGSDNDGDGDNSKPNKSTELELTSLSKIYV